MLVRRALTLLFALCPFVLSPCSAQAPPKAASKPDPFSLPAQREKANENLLMLLGGTQGGPYAQLAQDMATVVNDADNLRILPVASDGAKTNVRDILLLRGMDLGISSQHALNALKESGEYGPDLDRRIAYITVLSTDTFQVLARPEYKSLQELNGKKVNVLPKGAFTATIAPKLLKMLGVEIVPVNYSHSDAIQLMRLGEIDGSLCICPVPLPAFASVKEQGFNLLEVPYIAAFEQSYLPASVSSSHYPHLVAAGSKVQTIATNTVLIAYNWSPGSERYRKIEKFVNALFPKIDNLRRPPHHPVWNDVNVAAELRGWQRFPAAQQWLDRRNAEAAASKKAPPPGVDLKQAATQAAKAAPHDPAEQERLFREFLEWTRKQPTR
jgi:TRAP-type uncharacterized transport system substrate-binding protein